MQTDDASTEVLPKPKLLGLKAGMTLAVALMFGWGFYLLLGAEPLHAAIRDALRDLPDGVRKLAIVVANLALFAVPSIGAFYGLMRLGLRFDMRQQFGASPADAWRRGSARGATQAREMTETMLAKLKEEGASPEMLAELKATLEASLARSEADSERRAALYEENPALAEHDVRLALENIRAKQRPKEF